MVTLGLFSSEQLSAGTKEQLFPSEREDMWLPAGHNLHRSLKLCYTSFSSLFSCLLGPVGMWFCLLCEVLSLRKSKSSLLWVLRGRRFPFLHRDLVPSPSFFFLLWCLPGFVCWSDFWPILGPNSLSLRYAKPLICLQPGSNSLIALIIHDQLRPNLNCSLSSLPYSVLTTPILPTLFKTSP